MRGGCDSSHSHLWPSTGARGGAMSERVEDGEGQGATATPMGTRGPLRIVFSDARRVGRNRGLHAILLLSHDSPSDTCLSLTGAVIHVLVLRSKLRWSAEEKREEGYGWVVLPSLAFPVLNFATPAVPVPRRSCSPNFVPRVRSPERQKWARWGVPPPPSLPLSRSLLLVHEARPPPAGRLPPPVLVIHSTTPPALGESGDQFSPPSPSAPSRPVS